ncbi:sensor domain-containing diguanylate cyclase [Paenibacillus sp. NFR01]|uniref:sensor domain-containing diguanylate cyclase n=1 Tax=Paenibacillus sp. NFR01 TaxID=1566279 RepID=UPI0008D2EAE1|nr:sensor domain-containing diguanylate cyclase [Paenibacillus sp. NFR01]SET13682.1 diguanylate cyclase (GGDEF) domain-containing protein [Paenibacillus sp. NFR01]
MTMGRSAGNKLRRKLSLTSLLIVLVTLVSLLTSTILLVASYESQKKSLIDTTLNLNLSNAERMSKTVDSLFLTMRGSLRYSADRLSKMDRTKQAQVNEFLELLRNSSHFFNSILLVGADGKVIGNSPKTLGMEGKLLTSPHARTALELRDTYVSEPYISYTSGKLIIFMSEPLYTEEGKYLGQLGGTVYLQEYNMLNTIFENNSHDSSGSFYYIVSSGGHMLFHPDPYRINEDVSGEPVVQRLMNGETGHMQETYDSQPTMLAGYSTAQSSGWGVVVASPKSAVQSQLSDNFRKIIAYTVTPFVVLLLCVILLAQQLAKPFVTLANLMSRAGKDTMELPELRPHWNREADLLTRAVAIAWTNVQKHADELTREASTDRLTGLSNRRFLEITSAQWIAAGQPFSLVVMDVDRFKFVNDTYGHLAGDEVLRRVAQILTANVRPGDVCCRLGGEEFVILLPRTKLEDAFTVAERIRLALESNDAPLAMRVTSSLGIAHYPTQGETWEELLGQADEALYIAKRSGRNKTVVAGNLS